jgi:anti-sigma regulatory factor (Ser/Thr protein kinase)
MHDLSLHVLDLIENSIRAGASVVQVSVEQDELRDVLRITVEDNGAGFSVAPQTALDPFYTTKQGKRTGLGLSLLSDAAQQAGGDLAIGTSPLGGARVCATMRLRHLDRLPMGDLAASVSSVVATNPDVDLVCRLRVGEKESVLRSSEAGRELPADQRQGLAVALRVMEELNATLAALHVAG